LKDKVTVGGKETSILDVLNPPGMFDDGVRVHQWTTKNLLPMSGKLITEFDRRRNIRDMFSRKPSMPISQSSNGTLSNAIAVDEIPRSMPNISQSIIEQLEQGQPDVLAPSLQTNVTLPRSSESTKRNQNESSMPAAKRVKSASQPSNAGESKKGQKSLRGFFQPKTSSKSVSQSNGMDGADEDKATPTAAAEKQETQNIIAVSATNNTPTPSPARSQQSDGDNFVDPIVSKESWGKLFVKPAAPKCEHGEPCKTMLTKKTGVNCGRSFWMCNRPLGPSGNKEKGTQWRCSTFIWASDWSSGG
jgi:AP endonuclease 2